MMTKTRKTLIAVGSVSVATLLALPLLCRDGCHGKMAQPKVEPLQTIVRIESGNPGGCVPDTFRLKGNNGAPDTLAVRCTSPPAPEKKPEPKKPAPIKHAVAKAAPKVENKCPTCPGGLETPGSAGGDEKALIQGYVHRHAAQITTEFGISRVDFTISVYVSPTGVIDSENFSVTNASAPVSRATLRAQVIPASVTGTQVEAPGGSRDCRWTFYATAQQ
jgi:hypothetical protein